MTNASSIGRRTAHWASAWRPAPRRWRRDVRAHRPKEVKIAMLVPLSGPWARQGILEQMGARDGDRRHQQRRRHQGARRREAEADRIRHRRFSAEKAKDAAQRLVAQEPDVVGGFGCWLSTFTLAATEVTERAELPWLTLSYSDADHRPRLQVRIPVLADRGCAGRGRCCRGSSSWPRRPSGKRPTKVAFIGDNSAASVSFMKPIRDHVLKNLDLTSVADEVYTPPLADATTIVQHIRSGRPDFVVFQSTNVPDDKLLVDKFAEMGLSAATKLPKVGGGGHWCVPELLKVAGAENLEGVLVGLANWPGKAVEDVSKRFIERTKEPWFGHDSIFAYVHVMILKEAVERAGVAERHKVMQAHPRARHEGRARRCSSPTAR